MDNAVMTSSRLVGAIAASLAATLLLGSCASNPATGGSNVVLSSQASEIESSRRAYDQIIKVYGVYEDQAIQDYVNSVGQRVARNSDMPDLTWKFTVLDEGSINAFTTGGGYIYVNRGLLSYLNSEAELAAVLGHELTHVTARHPQRAMTRSTLAQLGALGAAILTGNGAVADLANIGASALVQGYGREAEMEADRIGIKYGESGYDPTAMGRVFASRPETFGGQRRGTTSRVYHGVFSSTRAGRSHVQAARVAESPMCPKAVMS
jgi:predicted Zn-dependent protease